MSQQAFDTLKQLQPAAINVGGANGTNFAMIERRRNRQADNFNIDQFGLSTIESLLSAQLAQNTLPVIATGGIASANDVMTSLMLGATMTSSAGYMLNTLMTHGEAGLIDEIISWQRALPRLMTLLGARHLSELPSKPRLYAPNLQNFINQSKNATP